MSDSTSDDCLKMGPTSMGNGRRIVRAPLHVSTRIDLVSSTEDARSYRVYRLSQCLCWPPAIEIKRSLNPPLAATPSTIDLINLIGTGRPLHFEFLLPAVKGFATTVIETIGRPADPDKHFELIAPMVAIKDAEDGRPQTCFRLIDLIDVQERHIEAYIEENRI